MTIDERGWWGGPGSARRGRRKTPPGAPTPTATQKVWGTISDRPGVRERHRFPYPVEVHGKLTGCDVRCWRPGPSDRSDMDSTTSRAASRNSAFTIGAASITPILYLVFINRYASNSFYDDDWSVTPMLRAALNGHVSLSQLWAQHFESRLLLGNVIDVLFGFIDRFNMQTIIFLSAGLYVATYAVLLTILRHYLRRTLTPVPVLLVGVTWFSLADVQNSLWAFQVSWYLTVMFFVFMLYALQVPRTRRALWFALAVGAAVAASLSTVQGFLCWPIGALAFIWSQPWTRRAFREVAVWCSVAALTLAAYLYGYQSSNTPCHPACSASATLHHPVTVIGFFFALLGDVIPGGVNLGGVVHAGGGYGGFEELGVVLFAVSVFIVVQSWRHRGRRSGTRFRFCWSVSRYSLTRPSRWGGAPAAIWPSATVT